MKVRKEDFAKIEIKDLKSIFNVKHWYLLYFDENDEELDFYGYERIQLTNPLFESDLNFSHDLSIRKTSNFFKLSLTTSNMLHYIINQEYNYEKSNKKQAVMDVNFCFYRTVSDPSIYSSKFLEYMSKNPEKFSNHIVINQHNQIISPLYEDPFISAPFINKDVINFSIEFSYEFIINKNQFFEYEKKGFVTK